MALCRIRKRGNLGNILAGIHPGTSGDFVRYPLILACALSNSSWLGKKLLIIEHPYQKSI